MSPWHNPTTRKRYAIFRVVLVVITILLAITILITLVR
jgi:hypothetical protein